jgi:hypothetical protein
MATKKSTSSGSKQKPQPTRLENLAAKRPTFDETIDEQLVDHSGVFRVTSQIAQAQTGHDEGASTRFPNDSLVMAAQRDGFRDDGPTIDEAVDDHTIVDETVKAERRQRLATVAARARQTRARPRR